MVFAAVLFIAVVGVAAASAAAGGDESVDAADQLGDAHIEPCAATPPDDRSDPDGETADVIGWVEGYWYDEPLELDASDGLTEEEVESLAARTAARVEALRCLTFDELPDIEFMTREEYRATVEESLEGVSDADWQWERARLAKMLYAGQDDDPFDVHLSVRTGFPAAFYNFQDEFMGFIIEEPGEIEINQVTLAHELQHALQDQHFDLDAMINVETSDGSMAGRAIAEGDAVLLDSTYEDRCGTDAWVDECIIPSSPPAEEPAYWGLVIDMLAAYNSPLVAETHEAEGWGGVDQLLDEPPASMTEVLNPELLGSFKLADIEVPDRSSADWDRIVDDDGEPIKDRIGQHGLTAMLVAPSYETGGVVQAADINLFLTGHAGGDLTYVLPETEGWQNDYLYAYANDAGETGAVWKIAWSDGEHAETFADAYEAAILGMGGEALEDADRTYSLDPMEGYELAIEVMVEDDRVWIVSAPSVDALDEVHGEEPVQTPTPTPTPTPDADGIPGPAIAGTLFAIGALAGYLLLRTRR